MLKLIINADDLGLTPGCSTGIVKALTEGIVSDTTLMINTEHAPQAIELVKANGIKRVGLHLNLTYGQPVLPAASVPTLLDDSGRFRRRIAVSAPLLATEEVERELEAQVEKFLATGLELTHLDSHHHSHSYPQVLDIAIKLASQLKTPLRQTSPEVRDRIIAAGVKTTDWFTTDFYDQGVDLENLQMIIAGHDGGVLEIMCHPAREDELLFAVSSYNACRFKELAILTAPEIKRFLSEHGVKLISFAELTG
ncbi:MAG: YdjC family protein [Firmicutes bacterium]|nr:YdjC family protein [Bacillota bacterium]